MNILALDSSTKFLTIGILRGSHLYEYTLQTERKLSRLIAVTLKRVMDASGTSPVDFDYFVCGVGPGSFTGIRIGLSTIKGLNFFYQRPMVGISTLDIIAENAPVSNKKIVSCMDAKRGLVYRAVFKKNEAGLKRLKPHKLVNIKGFLEDIDNTSIITGDALQIYKEDILKKAPGAVFLDKDCWYPRAQAMIKLAQGVIAKGWFSSRIEPVYLYPKECQIRGQNDAK
jgi:tRNA threonylcarbamoyladenosine biosynthesis protein TsaB